MLSGQQICEENKSKLRLMDVVRKSLCKPRTTRHETNFRKPVGLGRHRKHAGPRRPGTVPVTAHGTNACGTVINGPQTAICRRRNLIEDDVTALPLKSDRIVEAKVAPNLRRNSFYERQMIAIQLVAQVICIKRNDMCRSPGHESI